jgi:hypothetical protein
MAVSVRSLPAPALLGAALLACSAAGCRSSARPRAPRPAAAPDQGLVSAPPDSARADSMGDTTRTAGRVRVDSADAVGRPGGALPDPSTAVRFEIVAVGDSTFAFLAPNATWLSVGSSGIAVDPRRRDILVARFRLIAMRADTGTALVTGQTTRLVTEHVAPWAPSSASSRACSCSDSGHASWRRSAADQQISGMRSVEPAPASTCTVSTEYSAHSGRRTVSR